MSPFANSPHLWLTGHLYRLRCEEHATKIQAIVRGYIVRRRQEKERNAQSVIDDVIRRLLFPPKDTSVVGLMYRLGLDIWANNLPTAEECLYSQEAAERRRNALWHAGISLRLNGQGHHLQDLEWADYHERGLALANAKPSPAVFSPRPAVTLRSVVVHPSDARVDTPRPSTPSFWSRLYKSVFG